MAMHEAEMLRLQREAQLDAEYEESIHEYLKTYYEAIARREEQILECYETIANKGIMKTPNPVAKDHIVLELSYDEYMKIMRRISANDSKLYDPIGFFR